MKGQKVAAVITLSDFHEDYAPALQSVVRLKEYFTGVHIVYPKNYAPPAEASILKDIPCHAHREELNPSALGDTLLLVYLRPDHAVEEAALIELLESAQENRRKCDHFAVRGRVDCEGQRHTYLLGFIWLLSFFDWFRTCINWWGYHTVDDLRAVKVTPVFPTGSIVPTYRHAWLFAIWSRIAWIRYNKHSLTVAPLRPRDYDTLVFRTVYTHPHIGLWNVQWLIGFVLYYFTFALPWWNAYFANIEYRHVFSKPSLYHAWSWIMWRNVWNPIWLALWVLQLLVCMWIVSRRYKHVSLGWVFLMPLYLTLAPLFFVVIRSGLFLSNKK